MVYGAISGLLIFLGSNLSTLLGDMCNGTLQTDVKQVKDLASKFIAFEYDVANWTSTYMCTSICPCETTVIPARWEETRLNKYNRTNRVINSNYTDPTTKRTYVGFSIPADNYNVQANFYNCYKNKL